MAEKNRYSAENFYDKSRSLGDLLTEVNRLLGDEVWFEEQGISKEDIDGPAPVEKQEKSDLWDPYTEEELDRIRHYYWQKMALESEGSLMGLIYPFAHEIIGKEGLIKTAFKMDSKGVQESLYDLYVNALGAKDHFYDEGMPGEGFYDRLKSGIPKEEFTMFGDKALDRMGYVPEESLSNY